MSDDRAARLAEVGKRLEGLSESPLYEDRARHGYRPVLGEGSPDARIMFIGEAPGKQEAATGRPFVGASGRVLSELLASIGLQREDVYITNVVKDRPPENRDPQAAEIELYRPLLEAQIDIIRPAVIATLGRFAMDFVFEHFGMAEAGGKISQLHGQVLTAQAPYGEVAVVPLYHPAVALYNQNQRGTLEADFQALAPFA